MSITPDIVSNLPLSDIDAVVFYKRDELATDLICCDVEASGRVWTFYEEASGWKDLMTHLSGLPDFRNDWFTAVVSPAFTTSETIAYRRN